MFLGIDKNVYREFNEINVFSILFKRRKERETSRCGKVIYFVFIHLKRKQVKCITKSHFIFISVILQHFPDINGITTQFERLQLNAVHTIYS